MSTTPSRLWGCQRARSADRVLLRLHRRSGGLVREWSLSRAEFRQLQDEIELCGAAIDMEEIRAWIYGQAPQPEERVA